MTASSSPPTLSKADLELRDRIHRKAVAVVADSIRAMRGPADPMSTLRHATAMSDAGRECAEWNLTMMEQMRALLGFGADVPKDKGSYVQGFHAALVFIAGAMSRPWVTVSIEQDAPKAEAVQAKTGDRLAKLLEELKKATGKDIGIEVVSVDLGGPAGQAAFPDGDLAKEMMEGLSKLLGGRGMVDGTGYTCAKDDELLNVIRVKDRPKDAPPCPWTDENGVPFDLQPGDLIEERYKPSPSKPEGRLLVSRRTGQRAPFGRPGRTWRDVFEVVEKVFVCSCNR